MLTFIKDTEWRKNLRRSLFRCSCWKEVECFYSSVTRKDRPTKSCWCLVNSLNWETKKNKHFYNAYQTAIHRCKYKYKWINFLRKNYFDFKKDMYEWYLEHCRVYWKENTTIERINVHWNYCKENCTWTTKEKQAINKTTNVMITYKWKTQAMAEWCRELWVSYYMVRSRINRWWDKIEALIKPKIVYNLTK